MKGILYIRTSTKDMAQNYYLTQHLKGCTNKK